MKPKKETIVLPVIDISGKEVEKVELDPRVFDGRVSKGSIYRTVHNYLANKRSGTASTKNRGEVSGGGKKPWRQKGTGRARVGSIRTPLWRHGGVTFGPHPRDFSYSLPKKIKKLALRSVLNNRILDKDMVVLNVLVLENYKTKSFVKILKKIKLKDKILLVINSFSENVMLSVRNIPNIQLVDSKSVNAYDVLRSKKILIIKDALHTITERLK
ncbi:50S ribosomal protein L4 [bacterium]|nr:50S ribosomal protein L4 [bacterium]